MRIEVRGLCLRYGAREAVAGVSHAFAEGKITALIGPNGSGKTTLIKLISGALRPNAGAVLLDGHDARPMGERRRARCIATVPQQSRLDFDFTVRDLVLMGRLPYLGRFQRERTEDARLASECMALLGLSGFEDRNARLLSGGEWQRVLVARALCQQTPALLMDEPVSNLDIRHQMELLKLIQTLSREKRVTGVIALHDLNLAAHYCDELLLMQDGKVVASGAPCDVLTTQRIARVYGIEAVVTPHPDGSVTITPTYL